MEIIWGRFVEKTGGQKSRATVPLTYLLGKEEHTEILRIPCTTRSTHTYILYIGTGVLYKSTSRYKLRFNHKSEYLSTE
jgi:hypothetical protein